LQGQGLSLPARRRLAAVTLLLSTFPSSNIRLDLAFHRRIAMLLSSSYAALAEELKSAQDRGEPDDGSQYYAHWLAALERLVTSKGLLDTASLLARKEAWTGAYRHTPHGRSVVLSEDV
jgi:hypothetical protein